jgi:hypothetical protein
MDGPLPDDSARIVRKQSPRLGAGFASWFVVCMVYIPLLALLLSNVPIHVLRRVPFGAYYASGTVVYSTCYLIYKAIFRTQSRLSEWLFMLFFFCTVVSILLPFSGRRTESIVTLTAFAFSWALIGAGLGWWWARKLEEMDTRRRFWLMVKGWCTVPGLIAALGTLSIGSACIIAKAMGENIRRPLHDFLWCVPFCVLAYPAIGVFKAIGKREAMSQKFPCITWVQRSKSLANTLAVFTQIVVAEILNFSMLPLNVVTVGLLFWISKGYEIEPCNLEEIPEDVDEFVNASAEKLKDVGFSSAPEYYSMFGQSNDFATYRAVFRHSNISDLAIVTCTCAAPKGMLAMRRDFIVFQTRTANEITFLTSNDPNPFPFVTSPKHRNIWFPKISEPDELYYIHHAWVAAEAKSSSACDQNTHSEIQRYLDEIVSFQIESGILFMDTKRAVHRLTWWGSSLLSVKISWPAKPILRAIERRRSNGILKTLEDSNLMAGTINVAMSSHAIKTPGFKNSSLSKVDQTASLG